MFGKKPRIKHDTFSKDGRWAPPGGDELYFHSGFSEPADGLESDGLGDANDPFILKLVSDAAKHSRSLKDLSENDRTKSEIEFARDQISEIRKRSLSSDL